MMIKKSYFAILKELVIDPTNLMIYFFSVWSIFSYLSLSQYDMEELHLSNMALY